MLFANHLFYSKVGWSLIRSRRGSRKPTDLYADKDGAPWSEVPAAFVSDIMALMVLVMVVSLLTFGTYAVGRKASRRRARMLKHRDS